jgi:hypothetical protein
MSPPKRNVHVFIISDGTGLTAERVITAVLVQFRQIKPIFKRFPYIKTKEQIEKRAPGLGKLGKQEKRYSYHRSAWSPLETDGKTLGHDACFSSRAVERIRRRIDPPC